MLYRRDGEDRERAKNHPLYWLLHEAPNSEMSAFQWKETVGTHLFLRGNHFSHIERDRANRIKALWPLSPDRMTVKRPQPSAPLVYEYRTDAGGKRLYEPYEILHVRGMSLDGIIGLSPITVARDVIGAAVATHEYGARFFSNSSLATGLLTPETHLQPEQMKELRESWERSQGGPGNWHRTVITPPNLKFTALSITPEDSQFIETMKFRVADVARIFGVPPHKVGDFDRATYSNIESTNREWIKTGEPMVHWNRLENEINRTLLSDRQQGEYFCEHLIDGLLRGDMEQRHTAYASGIQWGHLTPNEVRRMENRPPLGPEGDEPWMPSNMIFMPDPNEPEPEPVVVMAPAPEQEPEEDPGEAPAGDTVAVDEKTQAAARAFLPAFADVISRVVRREKADILASARHLLKRGRIEDFDAWLAEFQPQHEEWSSEQVEPLLRSFYLSVLGASGADVAGIGSLVGSRSSAFGHVRAGRVAEVREWAHAAGGDVSALEARMNNGGSEDPGMIADALVRAEYDAIRPLIGGSCGH
jgi:HK97 family phage portal protein